MSDGGTVYMTYKKGVRGNVCNHSFYGYFFAL